MSKRFTTFMVLILLVLVLAFNSVFVVKEGQRAIKLLFGKTVPASESSISYGPGLHFKIPFLNKVIFMDTRLLTLSQAADNILTDGQKSLTVDYYIKWRIKDLLKYYQATFGGNRQTAESLLEGRIKNALRGEFGQKSTKELISNQRQETMAEVLRLIRTQSSQLGITIKDFRIKQIDFPASVNDSIFKRMRTSREKVAAQLRSEGKGQAREIVGRAQKRQTEIISTAKAKAAQIVAQGYKQAAVIYTAYNKDPKFYAFYKSLEAYQQAFANKHDVIVVKPDSKFFKYFNNDAVGSGS